MACGWRSGLLAAVLALTLDPSIRCETPQDGDPLDILFIGNSLTYGNDLPAMLAELLAAGGVDVGRVETAAYPNYGLVDHWQDRRALKKLSDGEWDLVVLQQGPSATEGRPSLLEYSQRFAAEIRTAGAEPALYMVWPAATRSFDFPGVIESYGMAAEMVDGRLFAVGRAWVAAWREQSDLRLYGTDGFHPSVAGSALAALVMAAEILGETVSESVAAEVLGPRGLPLADLPVLLRASVRRSDG